MTVNIITKTPKGGKAPAGRAGGKIRVAQTVDRLNALCDSMSAGDRLPTHTELMRQLEMPERTVLAALKELYRVGRVERVQGSGTYVTEISTQHVAAPDLARLQYGTRPTIVALVRPDHSYFDRSIEHLSVHVLGASHEMVVLPIPNERNLARVAESLDLAAGYIVFSYELVDLARELYKRGKRVVNVGTLPGGAYADVPTVYCDQDAGGYQVASHIIGLGHRRLAFVHDDALGLGRTMRWQGHMRAVAHAQRTGLAVHSTVIDSDKLSYLYSDTVTARGYFTGPDAVTAVIAWNDVEAMRMLALFARHGISVPGEVSLAGYDATENGAIIFPSLTTVDNAIDQQLKAAVDLLTNPSAPPANYTVVLRPALISRESSGPVRILGS